MSKVLPEIKLMHDRVGVELFLPNDHAELNKEQLTAFHKLVVERIKELSDYVPPGPAPHRFGGHDSKDKSAKMEVGPRPGPTDKWEPYIYIGGYEVDVDELPKIQEWVDSAIEYFAGAEKEK